MASRGPLELGALSAAILNALGNRQEESFRVSARRTDKRLPQTSPEIEREVGGLIKLEKGWRVDLDRPALTVHIEMLPEYSFFYFGREPGAGGLPTGTSGKLACLLSGGIDSPVAAYRMMRRGCTLLFIHFHSYPILSRASQEKVLEITKLLTMHQLKSRLILVPFGELQQRVLLSCPSELRVVVYRRLMLRIAERLARRWGARAMVTGEVVGQVASQTVENLTTIAEATTLDILRPLLVAEGVQQIGTFVMGTVKGDVHDIGKNLVNIMLEGAGFTVIDLGVNVPPERFVEQIEEHKPEIVGFSAFLTTTMPMFKANINAIEKAGLRDRVKIMVGGAPVTQEYADVVGADGYAADASTAVRIAKDLVEQRRASLVTA